MVELNSAYLGNRKHPRIFEEYGHVSTVFYNVRKNDVKRAVFKALESEIKDRDILLRGFVRETESGDLILYSEPKVKLRIIEKHLGKMPYTHVRVSLPKEHKKFAYRFLELLAQALEH